MSSILLPVAYSDNATTSNSAALRSSHIDIDGMRIELLESGGTGTPIFFCHGNSSCAKAFAPIFHTELGRQYRLIAMSFPGHGGSAWANDTDRYSIPYLGDLAATVITRLGLRSYVLVGHSLGGHALLEAAWQFEGALGLMLVSSPPLSLSMLSQAFRPDPSEGLLFGGPLDMAQAAQLARCFVATPDSVALPSLIDGIVCTDPQFRPALLESLQRGDMRDEWQALSQTRWPVALLEGGHDRFLHTEYFKLVPQEQLWHGETLFFPACGHALHLEAPLQFSATLAQFVEEITTPLPDHAGISNISGQAR